MAKATKNNTLKLKFDTLKYAPAPESKSSAKIDAQYDLFINGKFEKVEGSEREIPADLVFLAMGFLGPEKSELITQLEVQLDPRGNVLRDEKFATSEEGIFVCGDAGRGQSLIVWAIAEGRSAAAAVDEYLLGETGLPAPILPTARSLTV